MTKKVLLKILYCIPFFAVWYFIGLGMSVAYTEGGLSVYKDAYGSAGVCIAIAGLVLSLGSILYLRLFIKKESVIQIVSFALTIVFVVCAITFANMGEKNFREFSTENWQRYPERRLTMYFDLTEKYEIKGSTENEVTDLLGAPDEIVENEYVYDCGFGNAVYVRFDNGVATSIYNIE